jgi:hypothetical protein
MAGHPGTLPMRLYRGDTYAWQVRVWGDEAHTQPVDLAGATATARLAGHASALDLACSITAPNLIDMDLLAADWEGVADLRSWDLQLEWADGTVRTLLAGPVTVQGDVTP